MTWRAAPARLEEAVLLAAFALSTAIPLSEAIGRPLGNLSLPGAAVYLQLVTLGLTFVGGLYAVRTDRHLTLSTAELFREGSRVRTLARVFTSAAAATVTAVLAYGAYHVVMADREMGTMLPIGVPQWAVETIIPLALGLMALRFAWRSGDSWRWRAAALLAIPAAFALGGVAVVPSWLVWVLVTLVLAALLFGLPVFAAMSGVALVLFFRDGTPVSAVPAEIYRLISSPALPAIPLLTACGYVLAESAAAHRLVRFFRALFGWMPGGLAVLVAGVCALFTTFTGGSGVTIIALGGLVYPILREDGYPERFSLGLVTTAGSLGLLFPPSLPVILYSVVASVPADQLYLAGVIPGMVLVLLVAGYGVFIGREVQRATSPFSWRELAAASWAAKWELLLPVFVVALFASGFASLVESAAAACAFAVIVECLVTRDIHPWRELPAVLLKAAALVGGVLILLASAMGLTSYLVDAQVPDALLAAVRSQISSPVVFLLVLNVILLVLGSVLEIYSAIIVLTPLVAPLGAAFGIDPVHLGVIFLANLEMGFILPPVGLNLFLSSSRFGVPIAKLYRDVLPFLVICGIGVLLITYLPFFSLGLVRALGR